MLNNQKMNAILKKLILFLMNMLPDKDPLSMRHTMLLGAEFERDRIKAGIYAIPFQKNSTELERRIIELINKES